MQVIVNVGSLGDAESAILTLERDGKGWNGFVALSDGRWAQTRDKDATDSIDGIMCDIQWVVDKMLGKPGGRGFLCRRGGPGLKEQES